MKGSNSSYRPTAGTHVLLSGPNCDNDDGYVFMEMTILWRDDTFVLYGQIGCWPVLNKWEHVIAKPVEKTNSAPKEWIAGGDLVGTHRQGYARFSYARIVEVFGEPTFTTTEKGARTAFEWAITFSDGTVAAIYEYKQSSLYGDADDAPTPEEMKRSFTDWHVGGKSQRAVELVTNALEQT